MLLEECSASAVFYFSLPDKIKKFFFSTSRMASPQACYKQEVLGHLQSLFSLQPATCILHWMGHPVLSRFAMHNGAGGMSVSWWHCFVERGGQTSQDVSFTAKEKALCLLEKSRASEEMPTLPWRALPEAVSTADICRLHGCQLPSPRLTADVSTAVSCRLHGCQLQSLH